MILVACVGERSGLLFFHKRLSFDRAVIRDILALQKDSARLFVTPYSAALFPADRVEVCSDPEKRAGSGDLYFVEDGSVPRDNVESIILYNWNRRYPFDRAFPSPEKHGFSVKTTEEFAGFSHEKITKTVYSPLKEGAFT